MPIVIASRNATCRACKKPIKAGGQMVWSRLKAYHISCAPVESTAGPVRGQLELLIPMETATRINVHVEAWPVLLVIVMLVLALLPTPYPYYNLLRLIVFGVSIYLGSKAVEAKRLWLLLLFVSIASLFN